MPVIAPIVAAIGTAVTAVGSFVASMGFVGQAVLGIGLSVAASYAQKALGGKTGKQPGGVQFERQYGGAVPRQVACGLVGIAGHDTYCSTYGPSNYEMHQLYTLSDYPSDGLSRVAINGKWVTLEPTESSPARGRVVTTGDFAGLIWIKFLDGRQTAALAPLVNFSHPAGRWTENHIGIGQTFVLVSMTFNDERNSSFPDFFFEFRGARLYDWRKDSTVGGSGPHRWDDPSTHEFTENPQLIEYAYRRGLSINGDMFCGMGMAPADLPLDKWTPAANLSDETTDHGPRYRCSIMLDCTAEHGENIASIQMACGAGTVDGVAGSWPVVGHDQPVAITFTDDDLIATAPVRWQARRSMSELVNSVAGKVANPDDVWSMVDYETQTSPALVALDRRNRDLTIDFPQVRIPGQAAALAAIYFKENRYEASAELTLRPRFLVLEPGDWVRWNSARYGSRVYLVKARTLVSLDGEGPRNVQLTLEERDGSIYDGVSAPVVSLPVPPGAPSYLAEVQSFTVVAILLTGADGRLQAGIRAAWEAVDDVTVTSVEVMYFPTAQPDAAILRTVPVSQTVVILDGVLSATEYRVRTRLVTEPARPVAWSTGALVTTDTLPEPDVEIYLGNIKGDAYATLRRLRADVDTMYARHDALVRDVAVGFGAQTKATSVAVRAANAAASAVTVLSASVSTLGDQVTAMAESYTEVVATVGNLSAGGLWKVEAQAGGGDVSTRLVIFMRASIGDVWTEVGTAWEAGITGGDPFSRETHIVGQFTIINPFDDARLPLLVADTDTDTVYIQAAWIKRLEADDITISGTLRGATGVSGWNFTADYIWIEAE